MERVIFGGVEEICSSGSRGLSLSSLWTSLGPSLSSLNLTLSLQIKAVIWTSLLNIPSLVFSINGVFYEPSDEKIKDVQVCENLGLRIVANEDLRSGFFGIYDIRASDAGISDIQRRVLERLAVARASDAGISDIQRRVLERLAIARTNGITQSELAKEFGIKHSNFFYVLRNLECRGLIMRHSTILRTVEAYGERESKTSSTVTTNMIHLHRYAKHLSSQQRLEVYKEDKTSVIDETADFDTVDGDGISAECVKEDVLVKDFLPALKAICEKLELAEGKVLVVADIKRDLGYQSERGHKAWRNILNRLKYARVVEEFYAKVNKKEVSCLRLLKSFSLQNFEHKTSQHGDGDVTVEQLGKRCQITDQLLELPIEHQIYDMIDAEGSKGLTITEICKRLGVNNKRYYTRLLNMFFKYRILLEAENHNKGVVYRVWTPGNAPHEASTAYANKPKKGPSVDTSKSSAEDDDSNKTLAQKIPELDVWTSEVDVDDSVKLLENATEPERPPGSPTDNAVRSIISPPESSTHNLSTPRKRKSYQRYPCLTLTAVSARREQWILQMLQEKKFIIRSELRRELDSFEKDKPTLTDGKTLCRALNKLQEERLCKCIKVSAPVVTNVGRNRTTEVILQESIDVTPELLGQIHERLRSFDIEIRNQRLPRSKKDEPVPILDGVQRIFKNTKLDSQAESSEVMRANGFVLAKMVRAKLLHTYLWNYLSSSPGWTDTLSSGKHGYDLKNPHSTCKLFSVDAVKKAMPFELFLQVVGSTQKSEDMIEKCRRGLCLSDLPDEDFKRMMDTRATGRLSWIVDVLRRLKLIRLVRDGQSEDNVTDVVHATLKYAFEVRPYIEEPVSVIEPSSGVVSFDLRPQIRHDFVLSSREAVDAYWNTLEYSYAAADSRAAKLAFPGSTVPEVFNFRSWTLVRVMTADQRAELRKRVENEDPNKKMTFKECEKVAKELNLTLEQVLRVYYDKRRRLPRFEEVLDSQGEDVQSHKKQVRSSRKRKKSSGGRLPTTTTESEPQKMTARAFDADYQFTEEHDISSASLGEQSSLLATSRCEDYGEATEKSDSSKEREHHSLIHDCALSRMNSKRSKRFAWTEKAERKLVVEYARERAALGAKFHRIDWSSLHDLPAPPNVCKRRMALLNRDLMFRKAMMRLCNVLGEQYAKHLDKKQSKPANCGDHSIIARDFVFGKGRNSNTSDSAEHNDELRLIKRWDNFENENVKLALEDVLRFKSKKKSGSVAERSNMNINAEENDPLDTSMEIDNNACENNVHMGNSSSRRISRKYTKLLNEGISVTRRAYESLAVSSAVELFKLIFLSTSSTPDAPNLLARTLRRYSEHDLFAAFNYLREKKIMIGGTVGSPFVLSQQFLHSISSSPFPTNTGKRAAKFSRLICEKEKDLIQEGMYIATDLQCGDMFHICALVLTGDFLVSPCLPDEGIGEPEDSRNSKRKVDCNKVSSRDKAKKRKLSTAGEMEISARREKGFPGIRLSLSRVRLSKMDAVEMYRDSYINNDTGAADQVNACPSTNIELSLSSSDMEQILNGGSSISKEIAATESEWEGMMRYAAGLMTIPATQLVNPFHPEIFKNIYSAIQNAGDQGLTMEEVAQIINMQGKDVPDLVVQALEAFGRVVKVNSYDSVHVVDSLYRSKYFLTSMATFSQHVEVALTTNSITDNAKYQPQQHEDVNRQPAAEQEKDVNIEVSKDVQLDDGMHKITILNLPKEVLIQSNEVQHMKAVKEYDQVKGTSTEGNPKNKTSEFRPGDFELCRPILPWVNGDGAINKIVYRGLVRRVLGILMQNPGMLEDNIVNQMSVLNPQNCRELLKLMIVDNHIIVRKMNQRTSGKPPLILSSLFRSNFQRSKLVCRKHYFANPVSTTLL